MYCEVWLRDDLKERLSHLRDDLNNIVSCAPEKFEVSSMILEPMTSGMPVQCSYELSYEAIKMARYTFFSNEEGLKNSG